MWNYTPWEEGLTDFKLIVIIDGEGNKIYATKENRQLIILLKAGNRQ